MLDEIINILRIIAFINAIGWMIYMAIVMNAQSEAQKMGFKCSKCGNQFTKTRKELANVQYKLVDNKLAYQLECPKCHQVDWQIQLPNYGKKDQTKIVNDSRKMWKLALWIAVIPSILAIFIPIGLIVYIPLLIIGLLLIRKR